MHPESPGYGATPAKLVRRNEERVLLKIMADDQDGLLYFYCESQRLTTVAMACGEVSTSIA